MPSHQSGSYVQLLEFSVHGLPSGAFTVFRMSGREAISELFRFELDLVSDDSDIDLTTLTGRQASLRITWLDQTRQIHGMLEWIELQDTTPQGQYIYRALLVPRLTRLALSRQNQIHGTAAPVTVKDVLGHELSGGQLKGRPAAAVSGRLGLSDFQLQLKQEYPQRDYIVQYEESDLAFVSRLCENYGIFYFFKHDDGRDVVVFGDSRVVFPMIGGPGPIAYRPVSGIINSEAASVSRFISRASLVPAHVYLRDYNHRNPGLTLEAEEPVDPSGHGAVVEYGAHFRTPQEGARLARIRAQELASRKLVFQGVGDSVHMSAGAVFDLSGHFRDDFNAGYLLTRVEHEATQAVGGIAEFTGPDHQTAYRNRFECLPKTVEFRPARRTPKPHMAGLSNAVIDASGSGQRAELDASGRYKIRQRFDWRDEAGGQASHYVRKAEPYGGANTGMHLPLLKGTEVIVACVNGDPDRPIIVGALHNEQSPNVVNARTNTRNRIRTTAGTLFEIDDGPASGNSPSSYARLHVTTGSDSYWRLGSEPPASDTVENNRTPDMSSMSGGATPGGDGLFEYTAGDCSSLIAGSAYRRVNGSSLDYVVGARRMSAATHNAVSTGQYQVIANGISMEASTGTISASSSPAAAPAGDMVVTTAGNFTQNIGTNTATSTGGNAVTVTKGTEVKRTHGSTASFMMGSSISMTLGSALGVTLGAKTDISGLMKVDFRLALDFTLRLGPVIDFSSHKKITATGGAEMKIKTIEIGTFVVAEVKALAAKLQTKGPSVEQAAVTATTGGPAVSVNALTVNT